MCKYANPMRPVLHVSIMWMVDQTDGWRRACNSPNEILLRGGCTANTQRGDILDNV